MSMCFYANAERVYATVTTDYSRLRLKAKQPISSKVE